MPLRVPEGDVAMRLAGEVARWTVGEALVFDDAFVRRPSGTRVAAPLRRGSSAKTSRRYRRGVFGFFANGWKGTGVFLRAASPWTSYSKFSMIVDLLREVERRQGLRESSTRGNDALRKIAILFNVTRPLRAIAASRPDARVADAVAALLFFEKAPPCSRVGGGKLLRERWAAKRSKLRDDATGAWLVDPAAVADDLAAPRELWMHWWARSVRSPHVAAAASPRLRLRGISTSWPRRRRDPS